MRVTNYSVIPKSYGFNNEETGHWLLASSPPLVHNNIVTYFDNKRVSRDSISQQTEPTFPDSCESLTVSLDFHVPTDELITDNDDVDEQSLVVWRNKLQQYEDLSSDETWRPSR
jgi:hypothetical protein